MDVRYRIDSGASIMSRYYDVGFATLVIAVVGCGNLAPFQQLPDGPAPSTALVQGVYSGQSDCDLIVTSPSGDQTMQNQAGAVTFEINDRGVPIVQGAEIRVGRTVTLEDFNVTYTRIGATPNGIVIHSDLGGSINSVTLSGTSIAELNMSTTGDIEYTITISYLDSAGFFYNSMCMTLLAP